MKDLLDSLASFRKVLKLLSVLVYRTKQNNFKRRRRLWIDEKLAMVIKYLLIRKV